MARKRRGDSEVNTEIEEASAPSEEAAIPENSSPENEAVEEKAEEAKAEEAEAPAAPKAKGIPLRAFLALAGKKRDQLAGFEHFAKKQKLKPMTVAEWRAAVEEFQKRPVK